jgi:sigma-B regulation protein RsbU (phosphoserine phosphatase)
MISHGAATAEEFEDFFENTVTGYLITAPDGAIFRANTPLSKWLGFNPDVMRGKRFSDFLSISGKVYYETHLAPLLRMQGFFAEVALDLVKASGERLPVTVNGMESHDAEGAPLFIRLAIFRSSERRQYEQDLLAARNELKVANAVLSRRVAEVVNERLEIEESLNRERHTAALREQFIAVLGHDLRNPIASIDAGVQALDKTPLNERARMITGLVRKSAIRMAGLVDNLLDFARGRLGGGIVLRREPVMLEEHLTHVVDELRSAWPEREITVAFDLPMLIDCDAGRLSQLLSNLVGNALTHGSADGPVEVRAFTDNGMFELYVVNAGEAIPAEAFARLFEPFTREDNRPSQQGLGLGLFIASEISKAHDGELSAKSTSAETRFTFRMPISLAARSG